MSIQNSTLTRAKRRARKYSNNAFKPIDKLKAKHKEKTKRLWSLRHEPDLFARALLGAKHSDPNFNEKAYHVAQRIPYWTETLGKVKREVIWASLSDEDFWLEGANPNLSAKEIREVMERKREKGEIKGSPRFSPEPDSPLGEAVHKAKEQTAMRPLAAGYKWTDFYKPDPERLKYWGVDDPEYQKEHGFNPAEARKHLLALVFAPAIEETKRLQAIKDRVFGVEHKEPIYAPKSGVGH